ncbi:MAG: MazG-like family protein [Rhizobiaceae bacterium]|nr:MazG-like family protein [Rhizobiaceae bacterium]
MKISENDIATLRNDRELRRTSVYGSDIVYGILDYFEARQNELLERVRKAEAEVPFTIRPAASAPTDSSRPALTLADLQAFHIKRQDEWCPDQKPDLSFRGCELGGECGEAQNVIKKLERERLGWRGSRDTREHLAEELADVIHCAVLCAITVGIEVEPAVIAKFNKTSADNDLSVFIASSAALAAGFGDEEKPRYTTRRLRLETDRAFERGRQHAFDEMQGTCVAIIPPTFYIGEQVEKHTGDYTAGGEVRAVFAMKNGAIRFVVEHQAEGGGSFCHIYSEKNLRKVAP